MKIDFLEVFFSLKLSSTVTVVRFQSFWGEQERPYSGLFLSSTESLDRNLDSN